MTEETLNQLKEKIIGIAMEVHTELGPGLLERVYQRCLKIALEDAGYRVQMELGLPVRFRGHLVDEEGYRLDLLIDDSVVIEVKSVSAINLFSKSNLGPISGWPTNLVGSSSTSMCSG